MGIGYEASSSLMHLSTEEYSTITNSRLLVVKAEAMAKIWAEMDALAVEYNGILANENIVLKDVNRQAKISKGENYKGLPYLVLDYPAVFDKENILAFRTMFWWGNFFSLTLHLQGIYKERYAALLQNNLLNTGTDGLYICVNDSAWEYDFGNDNYLLINELPKEKIIKMTNDKPFVKLSLKLGLEDYINVKPFMHNAFLRLALLLKAHPHIRH